MKIIVSRQELLTALLFSSKDDSRFTLCSVCIEVGPRSNKPNIIATDGRRLAVIQSQAEQPKDFCNEVASQMLLTSDFVKAICALSKAIGGKIFPWIQFNNTNGSSQVFVELIGGDCSLNTATGALVEGSFPNWRAVVPSKKLERTQVSDLGINAEFVGDFAKAAKIFDLNPIIQINLIAKESALEVKLSCADYFYGLIMPCKADEEENYQPEFLGIAENLPIKEVPPAAEKQSEINVGDGKMEVVVDGKKKVRMSKEELMTDIAGKFKK
jgi:hypothetical protein